MFPQIIIFYCEKVMKSCRKKKKVRRFVKVDIIVHLFYNSELERVGFLMAFV